MTSTSGAKAWAKWAWVGLVIGAGWPLVVAVVWFATSAPAPSIHVRWAPAVTDEVRRQAEQDLRLGSPDQLEGRTWAYDLLDATTKNIQRVVKHPAVEDTQDIDREAFVLGPNVAQGQLTSWAADRFPVLRNRMLLWGFALIGVFSAAVLWVSRSSGRKAVVSKS